LVRAGGVVVADVLGDDAREVPVVEHEQMIEAFAPQRAEEARAKESELRATSLSTLAQMVSSGSGITLLPQIAVAVENRRGQLEVRPFTSPAPHRTIALIWRPHSPFAETFRDLAEVFRSALRRSG
jgi:LysR family hydrogen peroxide-inducible transcriptional activator